MGTYLCEGCERHHRSDERDFIVWNDLWYCEDCWGPLQKAQKDFENGQIDNQYEESTDELSDYMIYERHFHFLTMKDTRKVIDEFFKRTA